MLYRRYFSSLGLQKFPSVIRKTIWANFFFLLCSNFAALDVALVEGGVILIVYICKVLLSKNKFWENSFVLSSTSALLSDHFITIKVIHVQLWVPAVTPELLLPSCVLQAVLRCLRQSRVKCKDSSWLESSVLYFQIVLWLRNTWLNKRLYNPYKIHKLNYKL